MPDLARAFAITLWESGRRAVYATDENAPGGRPFLDTVEIEMARPLRDQSIDFELGKTDVVELGPSELRRQPARRKLWPSAPVRLVALVFAPRVEDARIREALALAVDRAAIHNVLLQRQGEVSAALLPQWLSGYAFLFPAAADAARGRTLVAGIPAAARAITLGVEDTAARGAAGGRARGAGIPPAAGAITLGVEDTAARAIAERIALNARDAGLAVSVVPQAAGADVRLVEVRIGALYRARPRAGIAVSLGLPEPQPADSPEALYAAERALLESFRVIPLFHLPDVYGVNPRVKGKAGITPLGEWRFEDLWVEGGRP